MIERMHRVVLQLAPGCPVVLVGNKSDLPDVKVPTADGQAVADELNCQSFFETSAKTKENLSASFERIAILTAESVSAAAESGSLVESLDLEIPTTKSRGCC
jgi:GTPase SAR1 family protein